MKEKIPVILLIGAGHSGSTLMDLIMGSHSQIFGVGELSYFSRLYRADSPCGCGPFLDQCTFWREVFEGIDFSRLPLVYQPKKDFLFHGDHYYSDGNILDAKRYLDTLEDVYRNVIKVSGKKVIFDSSKNPDRARLITDSDRFDVMVVHLVRDGRGVLFSNTKRKKTALGIIWHWITVNIKSEIVKLRNKSGKNITVLYKDLVSHPDKVFRHVLSVQELSFEDSMLHFQKETNHQVGGNGPVKEKADSKLRMDIEWKQNLPLHSRLLFEGMAGWLNIFYKLTKRF